MSRWFPKRTGSRSWWRMALLNMVSIVASTLTTHLGAMCTLYTNNCFAPSYVRGFKQSVQGLEIYAHDKYGQDSGKVAWACQLLSSQQSPFACIACYSVLKALPYVSKTSSICTTAVGFSNSYLSSNSMNEERFNCPPRTCVAQHTPISVVQPHNQTHTICGLLPFSLASLFRTLP